MTSPPSRHAPLHAQALLASAGYGPRGWRAPVLPQTVSAAQGRVTGIVLVATRAIKHGEELLQNYRLNPGGPRPEWWVWAHQA